MHFFCNNFFKNHYFTCVETGLIVYAKILWFFKSPSLKNNITKPCIFLKIFTICGKKISSIRIIKILPQTVGTVFSPLILHFLFRFERIFWHEELQHNIIRHRFISQRVPIWEVCATVKLLELWPRKKKFCYVVCTTTHSYVVLM